MYQLFDEIFFPDPSYAREDGLLAIGGDLSVDRLLMAYMKGIFPWFEDDEQILWWSPDPRFVLKLEDFKIPESLERTVRKHKFTVSFDTAFQQVIRHCATINRKGEFGTWITPGMERAYIALHEEGFAHSVEAFDGKKLVGGLYGVSIGRAFFGESMFHVEPDASKVALYHLVKRLQRWRFLFIDSQIETDHMKGYGTTHISRDAYLKLLEEALRFDTHGGKWTNC